MAATDKRLLARKADDSGWESWAYGPQLSLTLADHAGAAVMELHDDSARLGIWRFTLACNPPALRLLAQFEAQQAIRLSGQPPQHDGDRACIICHNPIPEDAEECPVCHREQAAPSSTWALLRLWRFAKPYRLALLSGFLLTLLGTAAAMVPPYLTMPLMDDVLIPFQNGAPIDYDKVRLYLGGLLASAVLAWGLGWARTFILAWVSERIGADLRTTTYEHLQKLSLEYFGGKRTGDLISRIGSETDRICVFLSLHLLDFANDILMIVMTAVILVSINLAGAGDAGAAALHHLDDPRRARPAAAWLREGRSHLVGNHQRAGRHHPGIRVVKAFAQEKREVARFREANNRNLEVNDRVNTVWSLFSPTVTLLTEVGLLVVWIFGIWQVSQKQITVGVLAAFLAYIGRFYTRLDSMSRIVSVTQKPPPAPSASSTSWITFPACPNRRIRPSCRRSTAASNCARWGSATATVRSSVA